MAEMTDQQRKVYGLKKKGWTTSAVAAEMRISSRMVRLHLAEARRKVQGGVPPLPPPSGGTSAADASGASDAEKYESHGWQLSITILNKRGKDKTGTIKSFDGCYAHVNPETIDLYQAEGTGKRGSSADAAFNANKEYLFGIISKMQNDLNYLLLKPRSENVRLCKYHMADRDSQISKKYETEGTILKVIDKDGKLRFVVDWSEGKIPHFEAIHPQKAKPDLKRANKLLNEVADGYPTPQEGWEFIKSSLEQNRTNSEHIEKLAIALRTILPQPQVAPASQRKLEEYANRERFDYIG